MDNAVSLHLESWEKSARPLADKIVCELRPGGTADTTWFGWVVGGIFLGILGMF